MYEPTLQERVSSSAPLARRQRLSRWQCRALGPLEVRGLERIPAYGPAILAINHRSLIDGPFVFGFVERPVSCLVKDEAFVPFLGACLRSAGQIPVIRGRIDPGPVRLCLEILWAGGLVGIFPEGTRGDGLARRAHPGVGYLALRTGAVVLPVACHGTKRLHAVLRRPAMRMTVGAPLAFPRHPAHQLLNRRLSAAAAERVRLALAELVAATAPARAAATADPAGLAA